MTFSEYADKLNGSATVHIEGCGYCVTHQDVQVLIAQYGDREVISIEDNKDGIDVLPPDDFMCEGKIKIFLA